MKKKKKNYCQFNDNFNKCAAITLFTGMDAIISQLKDGSVTLRRRRRKTQTNAALQEMFQILEISRTQNRNSNILVSSQLNVVLSSPKATVEDKL